MISDAIDTLSIHDVHEHLPLESDRIRQRRHWSILFTPGCMTDFVSAGLDPRSEAMTALRTGRATDEQAWTVLERVWPVCRSTGYGQAVRWILRNLYGTEEWSRKAMPGVTERMSALVAPGFYERLLRQQGRILSVQNNALDAVNGGRMPFREACDYDWIYPDLFISDLLMPFSNPLPEQESAITVRTWDDQLALIDWYFDRYGSRAIAVKCGLGYLRSLDFMTRDERVARQAFREAQAIRDDSRALAHAHTQRPEFFRMHNEFMHHALRRCRQNHLPVKFHTGHLVGNTEPLRNLRRQLEDLVPLIEAYPDITFVIMHLAYPYSRPLITLAKSYPNVFADMSWMWVLSPQYGQDFCREFLTTAPSSKLLAFGGDHLYPEYSLAHAAFARAGIAKTLQTLCADGWMNEEEAILTASHVFRNNVEELYPTVAVGCKKQTGSDTC